jgi:hypothetical protein
MRWLKSFVAFSCISATVANSSAITQKDNVCTVKALGNKKNDVPNILDAFRRCGNGGRIIFPEDQNYWIGTRLNPVVDDVFIEWRGTWTVLFGLPFKSYSQRNADLLAVLRQHRLLAQQLVSYNVPKPSRGIHP